MATWRKVIVSGSSAVLNQISASGNIVPISDAGSDLGSSTLEWRDLYIDGTANIDTLSAGALGANLDHGNYNSTNVDIDSGAIDGVTIGGASAGAITGTTIDATTDFTIGGTVITDNTITDDGTLVIASTTATSFSDGNITNVGSIALDSIAADDGSSFTISNNWTNAGNTIADLGTVSAATSITATDLIGTNVDGILGADTARAITGTTIDATTDFTIGDTVVTDGVITDSTGLQLAANLDINGTADISGDLTLSAGGDGALRFSAASSIKILDNSATALVIEEADNAYLTFDTTDSSEQVIFNKNSTFNGTTIADLGTVTTANIDGGTVDGADITVGSGKTLDVSGGTLTLAADQISGNAINGGTISGADVDDTTAANIVAQIDDNEIPIAKLAQDAVTITAGDGLKTGGSVTLGGAVTLDFDASDIADTGIEANGENLRLSAQGTGISGGAGSTLSITPAQTAITSIYNTALKIGRASGDTYIDMGTADDNIDFYAGATKIIDLTTSGIDVTGALTVSSNATIEGNLIVNGDTTTLSTTNLAVGDQFIFAATGSAGTNVDSGLIVQSGSAVDSGSALYHDTTSERWAVAKGVGSTTSAVTPKQMVTTTTLSTSEPGSSDGDYGVGEMWVDTDDQTIWVRTA